MLFWTFQKFFAALSLSAGSQIGKIAGGWGGKATKEFLNGWKSKKPPKNFWSIENLGWSTKDALSKAGKGIDSWWKGIQKSNKKAQAEQKKAAEQAEKQRQKEDKTGKVSLSDDLAGLSKRTSQHRDPTKN